MRESCCAMPFRLASQLLSVHLLERLCAERVRRESLATECSLGWR